MTEPVPTSQATWRNRFIALNLTRIGGTALTIFGIIVWQGNVLREGGWTEVGFPMALIGLAISFLAPRWLARRWRTGG
ncbi:hypothetical protein [Allosphingosinicella vermicomposti]|uniref:hypothetical protein n=1 Tax=Allosphingosinicella vermicomposti TaxID=614671 RepID=UPI000D114D30|nr:hypothetical protein [Allosphingosinicella vermicomposti]